MPQQKKELKAPENIQYKYTYICFKINIHLYPCNNKMKRLVIVYISGICCRLIGLPSDGVGAVKDLRAKMALPACVGWKASQKMY